MQTITGQVAAFYENPGKAPNKIVLADRTQLKVWKSEKGLPPFLQGKEYEFTCEESEYQGKAEFTVKMAKQVGGFQSNGKASGRPQGAGYTRPETPKADGDRMWLCAHMTAFIKAGMVTSRDDYFVKLRWAMDGLSAITNPQHSRPGEPDDDIAF